MAGLTLKYDEISLILSVSALSLYIARKIIQPTSLVHPMLLGRQVDASQVRNPSESAVYRNFGVGSGTPLPTRPITRPCTILDFIEDDHPLRTLWNTEISNAQLREKVKALATGFLQTVKIQPRDSNVLLLLEDSFEYLVTDLALASLSIPTLSLTRLDLFSPIAETYPPSAIVVSSDYLDRVLELVVDHVEAGSAPTVVVVGHQNAGLVEEKSRSSGITVVRWEDLMDTTSTGIIDSVQPAAPNDVFTVTFTDNNQDGHPEGVQLMHINVTAGVAALQYIFPLSKAWSTSDSILSSHSLATPFGRAVAYTALLRGSSFATLPSASVFNSTATGLEEIIRAAENSSIPAPTALIVSAEHYIQMATAVLNHAKQSWLYSYAWRHKYSAYLAGQLSNDTVWDRLVFGPARVKALGPRLADSLTRILITGDPIPAELDVPFRIALSLPTVRALTHLIAAGPLNATHPLDLQTFTNEEGTMESDTTFEAVVHSGPPSLNVEAKLIGVDDAAVEAGADPVGQLYVRGPSIGQAVPPSTDLTRDGWIKTGYVAKVTTSGTFKVQLADKVQA